MENEMIDKLQKDHQKEKNNKIDSNDSLIGPLWKVNCDHLRYYIGQHFLLIGDMVRLHYISYTSVSY